MKEILQKAMKKRKGSQKGAGKESLVSLVSLAPVGSVALTDPVPPTGPMYRLEKQTEPNVSVDLESTLESQNTLEFCLVRENSESIHRPLRHVWMIHEFLCMCVFLHVMHVPVEINAEGRLTA